MTAFSKWIEEVLRARAITNTHMAEALDMTPSGFGKAIRQGTMSTDNLLRLAKVTGTPAPEVFRMAGKEAISALIESLYGAARQPQSPPLRELLEILDETPAYLPVALRTVRAVREAWQSQLSEDTAPLEARRAAGDTPRSRPAPKKKAPA